MAIMLWMLCPTVAICLSLGCDANTTTTSPDSGTVREITLSQTNSEDIDPTGGVGCRASPDGSIFYNKENNFYRAFKLADYGVTGRFQVKKLTFGLFGALAGGGVGAQPAEVSIYAYAGPVGTETIDLAKLTRYGDAMIQIHDMLTPTRIDVPIDAELPVNTSGMVVQFRVPDGVAAMDQLLLGVNYQGERASAYQLAPACGEITPVTFPAAGFLNAALVLSVTGDG